MGTVLLVSVIKFLIFVLSILTTAIILVYLERRISAFIQNRLGPNRVGPFGLLQPVADVVKLLLKEDIVPRNAYKAIHDLAPIISISVALSTFAVVPIGDTIELFGYTTKLMIADVNVGIMYILAMTSMGVYGITLAGWSSNNKYSLLGGLRSSAQMISYELSMGLAVIGVLMIAGTLRLLMFGLFFLSEYANMVTASAVITTLFLGGWHLPYAESLGLSPFAVSILQVLTFLAKVAVVLLFFIVIRWTLPRFRYDQLMDIGWKFMLPIAIANLLATGVVLLLLNS